MVGLLLVTHATLGEVLIECVCHVLNRSPAQLRALAVMPRDDPSDLLPEARRLVTELDRGDGVLVMADLFGASPANLAMKLLQPGRVLGLAGLNLPMLLRVLTYREHGPLEALVERAVTGACDGIVRMKPL
ncbi:PTS fructose transporter subunit IIA [Nitrogeniibacter mangrovi]|uniref:PTS fructose transporter subunit IIA n=1 Tax=Nitrogeniibacter mangrovi TaxID=2016596 RepID=A0A6C1B7G7_9RHOO|nr:PTS fructose transporter subunit IIA [Nitrogeniibacter mangrovi]QID19417.1 PTS fructose transporter subunit IIA [Nitrogeniibacter mangrovi]